MSRLTRYQQISWILLKYIYANITVKGDVAQRSRARNLRIALERLGPTFIKFGQAMSSQPDMFPAAYLEELEKLQDRVPPFATEDAVKVVEEELGKPIDKLFTKLSRRSWASASLAQVHIAFLPDGQEIALKIQRPNIKDIIEEDIAILYQVAAFLDRTRFGRFYDFRRFVDEFRETLLAELDFRREGRNIERLAKNLRFYDHIHLPKVYWEMSSERVLAMERIEGVRLDKLNQLEELPINRSHLAEELLEAYLKQIIEDGFFHADPHLGNILVEADGRIALLDMGVVGRLDDNLKDQVGRLLMSFADQDSNEVTNIILEAGAKSEFTNIKALEQDVRSMVVKYHYMVAAEMGIGKAMVDLVKLALRHEVKMPQGFNLLGRTLLYLDSVAFNLSPNLDYVDFIERSAQRLFGERLRSQYSPGKLTRSTLELNKLFLESAGRLNAILDKLIRDEVTIKFEHEHLQGMIRSLNQSANRLSFAIIVTGLLVGSALIIRTGAGGTFFGYPRLGFIWFISAALLGLYLLFRIIRAERS